MLQGPTKTLKVDTTGSEPRTGRQFAVDVAGSEDERQGC